MKTQKYRAPALDKGLDILELLSRAPGPLNMTEIAGGAGYSKSEIFRMLQVLEERNYIVRHNGDTAYALTNRLFMLGMERPLYKTLVEAAMPVMHRLAEEIQHPCHLVVASQEQIVVIACVDAPSDLGFVVRIGHRRPLLESTSGVVLFAYQTDDTRTRWLDALNPKHNDDWRKHFVDHANRVLKQGFAESPSPTVEGVRDLSAPILKHGLAIGALTIPYIDNRAANVTVGAGIERLCIAVKDISLGLIA